MADNFPAYTKWFTDDRFGMFIHWGLYSILARHEWIKSREQIPDDVYDEYFREFSPRRYDPAEWAALAKAAGMKYAVLTTKHHEGFCLFDTKLGDYSAPNTPAGRDLVKEYVDAFRAAGLKVGFYYSLIDWHHPDYPSAGHPNHPMRDDEEFGKRPRDFSRYQDYLHGQVRELLTNYGKIDILWFDFSYEAEDGTVMGGEKWKAVELVKMIRELQPEIILNNRLMPGHEAPGGSARLGDLSTPEQVIPPAGVRDADGDPALWEACVTMNGSWGYFRDDKNYKTPAQVIQMLVECVSKGGNLLFNVGPTALGEINPEAEDLLLQVGTWMDRNAESIYGCGPADLPKPEWGYFTASNDGKNLYAHILRKPIGEVPLTGLAGKIKKARLLEDGSEVQMVTPWNARGRDQDVFLKLPVHDPGLPDGYHQVVRLEWA